MADAPAPRKRLDAVLVKAFYPPGKHDREKSLALNAEFGPWLEADRLQCTILPGNEILLTRIPPTTQTAGEHRYHPANHPLAGQDRYRWYDRGDGNLLGYLNSETDLASAEAEVTKARDRKITEKSARDARRLAELRAITPESRTPRQKAELEDLEWFLIEFDESAKEPAPAPEAEAEKNAP